MIRWCFHFAFSQATHTLREMNPPAYRVRRATLEDLGVLLQLWSFMRFDADALARRATEFQVAEDANHSIVGAVGLQILGKHGHIHSEGFFDFSAADAVRPLLWERLTTLAKNHGLIRLWTREESTFWRQCDLTTADAAALEKIPPVLKERGSGWLTLKLREDVDELLSADGEFAIFVEAERRRSQQTIEQARLVRRIAIAIAVLLLLAVFGAAAYLLKRNAGLILPGSGR